MISHGFRWLIALAIGVSLQAAESIPNTLSEAEKADGWQLLFDGKSTEGWRGFRKQSFPAAGWLVRDGCLGHLGKGGGGDIITTAKFSDYDLRFEWRINAGGNSGLKYFIIEERRATIGHEYQLLGPVSDEEARRDPKHSTASFYDVLPVGAEALPRSPGQWNQSRIVIHGKQVEHWLNGSRVLAYELDSDAVRAGIQASKFRSVAGFGSKYPHHILLQDHGGEVWFRDIKLRPL